MGKYLFYDRLNTNNPLNEIYEGYLFSKFGENYDVEGLWYMRKPESGSLCSDEDNRSTNSSNSIGDIPSTIPVAVRRKRHVVNLNTTSDWEDKESPPAKKIKSQDTKRKGYPYGVSIDKVSKRGILPRCKYCRSSLGRGELHTILRENKKMPGKSWAEVHHYHLKCFRHLSIPEQDQLLAIIEATNETSHMVTRNLRTEIMKYRGREATYMKVQV